MRRIPSQMGFFVEGCPAGTGRLNIPWLLSELRNRNPRADQISAVIELWTPAGATIDETLQREAAWAEASVRSLRSWIPD